MFSMDPSVFLYALGCAVLAGLATNLLVAPVTRLAVTFRAFDHPGGRRHQEGSVPRLGGVAIATGIALATGAAAAARWRDWSVGLSRQEIMALGFGTMLVFVVGLVDDLVGVGPGIKFAFQILAAGLLLSVGWSFEVMRLPLLGEVHLGWFGGLVSLVWIVGVTNAINLIDGLDGLAGGVVTIIASSFLAYAFFQGNPGTVILMAAVAGACIGFLRHNWEPARIFMGDSGALTLGFLLAAMTVHSSLKAPAAVAILVPILALGVPVIDTLLVMGVRFLDRTRGRTATRFLRMFRADRNHLHHLLAHFGGKRSRVVGVIYALVFASCAMALVVATTGDFALGVTLVVLEFVVIFVIRQMGLGIRARRLALLHREELKGDILGPTSDSAVVRRFVR
jgi:UDP-GlcNAc:undecaprenyl-phosphate GlcNAc-1-phosphate transferase